MAPPPTYPEYMATNLATDPDYPHHRQFSDHLTGPALDNTTDVLQDVPLQDAICEPSSRLVGRTLSARVRITLRQPKGTLP
jgi:hypothetical protein